MGRNLTRRPLGKVGWPMGVEPITFVGELVVGVDPRPQSIEGQVGQPFVGPDTREVLALPVDVVAHLGGPLPVRALPDRPRSPAAPHGAMLRGRLTSRGRDERLHFQRSHERPSAYLVRPDSPRRDQPLHGPAADPQSLGDFGDAEQLGHFATSLFPVVVRGQVNLWKPYTLHSGQTSGFGW
jgi:hypothetical protein